MKILLNIIYIYILNINKNIYINNEYSINVIEWWLWSIFRLRYGIKGLYQELKIKKMY